MTSNLLKSEYPLGSIVYMGGQGMNFERFTRCWGYLSAYNERYFGHNKIYYPDTTTHTLHYAARNEYAKNFLGDWLLMLDSDQTFPPDFAYRMARLADKYEVDVLLAPYRSRIPPHHPILFLWDDEEKAFAQFARIRLKEGLDPSKHEVARTDMAGAGGLFVRRKVFDKILAEMEEEPFSQMGKLSEDFAFFHRCTECGIPVYFTPFIELGHLTVKEITAEDAHDEWAEYYPPVTLGGKAA